MTQDLWKRMTVHNTDYLKPIPQNEVSIDRECAISHISLSLSGNLPACRQVHFIIVISLLQDAARIKQLTAVQIEFLLYII